jgi:hypothetical protein
MHAKARSRAGATHTSVKSAQEGASMCRTDSYIVTALFRPDGNLLENGAVHQFMFYDFA